MTEPNGFYYMRARYYDPKVGRFISEDPIGFEGGDVNLMAYVGNNPLLLIDPLGLCSEGPSPAKQIAFGFMATGVVVWEAAKIVATDVTKVVVGAKVGEVLKLSHAAEFALDKTYTAYGVYTAGDEFKEMGERIRTRIEKLRKWWYGE